MQAGRRGRCVCVSCVHRRNAGRKSQPLGNADLPVGSSHLGTPTPRSALRISRRCQSGDWRSRLPRLYQAAAGTDEVMQRQHDGRVWSEYREAVEPGDESQGNPAERSHERKLYRAGNCKGVDASGFGGICRSARSTWEGCAARAAVNANCHPEVLRRIWPVCRTRLDPSEYLRMTVECLTMTSWQHFRDV